MPALTKTDSPLPIRAAQAILAYLDSLSALNGVNCVRDDSPVEAPVPRLVVDCTNFKQAWAGSDEFEGELRVCYISGRDADANADGVSAQDADHVANQTAHHAVAAAISNALEDQQGARSFINYGAANRPATDLHLYALLEHQETGERGQESGTNWQTDFMRVIKCARCDYSA